MTAIPLNATTQAALNEFASAIQNLTDKRSIYLQAILDSAGASRESKWTLDQTGSQLIPVADQSSVTATPDTATTSENDKPAKQNVNG